MIFSEVFQTKHFAMGEMPNMRKLIIPDEGYTMFDMDLSRADAQVVAWDAGEENMKRAFRQGLDLHLFNANIVYRLGVSEEVMVEGHPLYEEAVSKFSKPRAMTKAGGHALNYGVLPPTLARTLGITKTEAEEFSSAWFTRYPALKEWQLRIQLELQKTRTVTNAFGYSFTFLDRIENIINAAYAWTPQSTVALVINHALCQLSEIFPTLDPLLQVHDSLVFQIPTPEVSILMPQIKKVALVTVPYQDPLIIPVNFKSSTKSWGHVTPYLD